MTLKMHLLPLMILLASLSFVLAAPSHYCGLVPPFQVRNAVANETSDDVLVSAWYPGWLGGDYPPSNIPWQKYTAMTFAFATTTPDVSNLKLDNVSQAYLPQFVSLAKQNNVKALVSVGGWTGSQYFSTAVATAGNRTALVKTIVDFATQYKLDGIDFDWEYPNGSGLTCNQKSADDSANFLAFLRALREDSVGHNLILSAAVGMKPFVGPDGQPMADVSAFAEVFNYIAIMPYDIYGPWSSTVGPNAPLYDSCASTQVGSSQTAVKAWTSAGFPADQLSLGIASYGHSFLVNSSLALDASGKMVLNPSFSGTPNGDKWDGGPGNDPCGVYINHPGGIFNFFGLIDAGFLNANGTVAPGIDYLYDNCSQTPYVYNQTSQVLVSYDDADSFAAKGRFVNTNGMKGVTMWTVAGDFNNILIDSIHEAMNIEQDCS